MTRCRTLIAIGVLYLCGVEGASAQVPAAYQIEDLGSLGGSILVGTAINANGDVAGYAELPDGTYHAFRWTRAGGLEDLGANGGWFAQAFGINDNGDVVGMYINADFNQHGFIAPRGGTMQDLFTGDRPIQLAASITSDGRLAGSLAPSLLAGTHAFRTTSDGSVQDLGSAELTSSASDINELGDVTGAGWHSTSALEPITAFRYSDAGGKIDLGTLGGLTSIGLSINSSSVVVGLASDANNIGHAFRAQPGLPLEDLGMLGGAFPQSAAEAINDSGVIVGFTTTSSGWTAFVHTDETGMIDLDTRIPASTDGWRGLNDARAINNGGQIVVEYATLGRIGTYLLTPVAADTVAPTITSASATPDVLTPPDGRMIPVSLTVSAIDDANDAPSCGIVDVIDSEGPAGPGNPSVRMTGPLTLELRASRLGSGTGRTYTVRVQCADVNGNAAATDVVVKVPHDERQK